MRTLLLGGGTLLKETTFLGVGVWAPKSLYRFYSPETVAEREVDGGVASAALGSE